MFRRFSSSSTTRMRAGCCLITSGAPPCDPMRNDRGFASAAVRRPDSEAARGMPRRAASRRPIARRVTRRHRRPGSTPARPSAAPDRAPAERRRRLHAAAAGRRLQQLLRVRFPALTQAIVDGLRLLGMPHLGVQLRDAHRVLRQTRIEARRRGLERQRDELVARPTQRRGELVESPPKRPGWNVTPNASRPPRARGPRRRHATAKARGGGVRSGASTPRGVRPPSRHRPTTGRRA